MRSRGGPRPTLLARSLSCPAAQLGPCLRYDIFGKYGAIRQIRLGSGKDTRGTAYAPHTLRVAARLLGR